MADTLSIPFDNSYAALPPVFYTRRAPVPVKAPRLIRVNRDLATALGIDPDALERPEGVAALAGNAVPEGAAPLAQVYAGHQFGGWAGRLGDGRAILLGEVVGRDGLRRDIQLKGSGPTPYSRMGDGRAWLGPVLREYVVSEAMAAMGIPTTRALAAVETGETVIRERPLPGAILTRVAASHIRVGTFQYFAAAGDEEALRLLADHAIARHWPEAGDALGLLGAVVQAQAALVARWLGAGFIHGVMNTDNTTISGETIDYGPCAFMDRYEPGKVFSSIDQFGRYAYNRQPDVMMWNLAQFATALLPLMGRDRQDAVDAATEVVNGFAPAFQAAWRDVFRAKIGIGGAEEEDSALIHRLLELMTAASADFTNTFRDLGTPRARDHFVDRDAFDAWEAGRQARAARSPDPEAAEAAMRRANPALIPRNHRVEQAIAAATEGDFAPFERLLEATGRPFDPRPGDDDLRRPPEPEEEVRQTFCGT